MRYAHDVMELMGPFPGRGWKMADIVRYISRGRDLSLQERRAIRKGVARVIESLVEAGCVTVQDAEKQGSYAVYSWKTP